MDNLKMLPEFLFTVGHSMQDISRDDFSLLNGGETVVANHHIDKDMCPTLIARIQNPSPLSAPGHELPKHLNNTADDNVAAASFVPTIKLENSNSIDLFPTHPSTWQQHPMNSHELAHHRLSVHHRFPHNNNSKLLLQGSDDPLISHGANSVLSQDDEHPADFAKCLMTTGQQHQQHQPPRAAHATLQESSSFSATARTPQPPEPSNQRPVKSGCSNLTKQQLKAKANLMSARNQQQQLLQQQQQQQQQQLQKEGGSAAITSQTTSQKSRLVKSKKKTTNSIKLRFHHQALPPEYLSHYEATQGQIRATKPPPQKTASQQRSSNQKPSNTNPSRQTQPRSSHENVRSWLQKIAEIQRTANASKAEEQLAQRTASNVSSNATKVEESSGACLRPPLDNNNNSQQNQTSQASLKINPSSTELNNTCLHNPDPRVVISNSAASSHKRYYSDLPYMGEITLDNSKPRRGRKPKKADICHLIYKNYGTVLHKRPEDSQNGVNMDTIDLKYEANGEIKLKTEHDEPLNLCLRDQPTDAYSISSADDGSETNSSCPTPITTPSDFARDSMLANNLKKSLTNLNELETEQIKVVNVPMHKPASSNEEAALNPLTMYYHRLIESGALLPNTSGPLRTIQKDNQLALKIRIPSGLFPSHKLEKPSAASPIPSNGNSFDYPEQLSTPSSIKSENSCLTNASSSTLMGTSTSSQHYQQQQQQLAPQKRKRSAIFIPPMNVENTSNPTTEVSICKFKFTGGSKPSLQEKKMLSVDAGGNYRYFSGTGDKTSRGYEYFPRESLQQTAGLLPGVNCTGQKLMIDIPPPSAGLSNELLQIPESPTSSMLMASTSSSTNGNVVGTIPAKTPPPSSSQTELSAVSFDLNKNEVCPGYLEDSTVYNQNSSASANALNNRFVVARKKQALHQLRKSTQREKLEKTFKEQGFLIQTQQLESAEGATYCKFRQLKKFTRYLFRNWKDYLPDDLQKNPNAAAALAAAAAAENFSPHDQEVEEASSSMAANLTMKSCIENVITCRDDDI